MCRLVVSVPQSNAARIISPINSCFYLLIPWARHRLVLTLQALSSVVS